jgi:hypothetical protein
MDLVVAGSGLSVTTPEGTVVERQVPLPERWVRGLAEAAPILAGMDLRAEITPTEARRFLTTMSGQQGTGVLWITAAGGVLRLTGRPTPDAVCLADGQRLRPLIPILAMASAVRLFSAPTTGEPACTAWQLLLPDARVTLLVSPRSWRGLSGEGGLLTALATDTAADDADLVGSAIETAAAIDVAALADRFELSMSRVRDALLMLSTSGRLGFDLDDSAYFHRDLPFAATAESLNPRLRAARELVAAGAVAVFDDHVAVTVRDHVHHVRARGDAMSCTCQWWSRYAETRGPCSHILAARIVASGE